LSSIHANVSLKYQNHKKIILGYVP